METSVAEDTTYRVDGTGSAAPSLDPESACSYPPPERAFGTPRSMPPTWQSTATERALARLACGMRTAMPHRSVVYGTDGWIEFGQPLWAGEVVLHAGKEEVRFKEPHRIIRTLDAIGSQCLTSCSAATARV